MKEKVFYLLVLLSFAINLVPYLAWQWVVQNHRRSGDVPIQYGRDHMNLELVVLPAETVTSLTPSSIRIIRTAASAFKTPVMYVRATFSSLDGKHSVRKYLLSSGTIGHDEEKYLSSQSLVGEHIEFTLLARKKDSKPSSWFSSYGVDLQFPGKVQVVEENKPSGNASGTYRVDLYARVEYSSLKLAVRDLDIAQRLAFIGSEAFSVSFLLTMEDARMSLESWFSDWLISDSTTSALTNGTVVKNNYDFNYAATSHSMNDLSKCSSGEFTKRLYKRSVEVSEPVQASGYSHRYRYQLVLLGDSQPEKECKRFEALANPSAEQFFPLVVNEASASVVYVSLKCLKKPGAITVNEGWPNWLTQVAIRLQSSVPKDTKQVWFFNFAGLWEAAMGKISEDNGLKYISTAKHLLKIITKHVDRVNEQEDEGLVNGNLFYMLTTMVNPIQYTILSKDRAKRSMNQVRVEYTNNILSDILKQQPNHAVTVVDTGQLSKVGEKDPLLPTDMRHLGETTNDKLINFLLCHAFKGFL